MAKIKKILLGFLFATCVLITLSGCDAEKALPIPIQKVNAPASNEENNLMVLDAQGVINGVYKPGDIEVNKPNFYPINYTGSWRLIKSYRGNLYIITSAEAGARVDVVATLSRVTFDFVDPDTYDKPGDVTFLIDGKPLGNFALKTKSSDGTNIMNYQIASQKKTVATISMILNSGRVAINGYILTFLGKLTVR